MSHVNNTEHKGESVTFRIDPALKAELNRLAAHKHKSLGALIREVVQQRLAQERRRVFEDDARRQSREAAAVARNSATDEAAVMRELETDLDAFDEWR